MQLLLYHPSGYELLQLCVHPPSFCLEMCLPCSHLKLSEWNSLPTDIPMNEWASCFLADLSSEVTSNSDLIFLVPNSIYQYLYHLFIFFLPNASSSSAPYTCTNTHTHTLRDVKLCKIQDDLFCLVHIHAPRTYLYGMDMWIISEGRWHWN